MRLFSDFFATLTLPLRWYGVALAIFVLDISSKMWAAEALSDGDRFVMTSFFQFALAHNYGAAFSFLADGDGWQRWFLGALAAGVSIGIAIWLARLDRSRWLEALALSCVLGGALGNLYDRVTLGYVIDFILVHYKQYAWPTFNVADIGISLGAVLLLYDAFINKNDVSKSESIDECGK